MMGGCVLTVTIASLYNCCGFDERERAHGKHRSRRSQLEEGQKLQMYLLWLAALRNHHPLFSLHRIGPSEKTLGTSTGPGPQVSLISSKEDDFYLAEGAGFLQLGPGKWRQADGPVAVGVLARPRGAPFLILPPGGGRGPTPDAEAGAFQADRRAHHL
ncbi:hypothetical protein NDU88_004346 [Pleurodeles waltl]|uniref:Uncharacterized protein n=1 Tax=Pleurodeles waltl TaxID=8319 RepID=A0AAV7PC91_PLEWA|nr:hypothetical protein NDU88_004346 [Pleurodeles waltl]